jgi:hypothetical protein
MGNREIYGKFALNINVQARRTRDQLAELTASRGD